MSVGASVQKEQFEREGFAVYEEVLDAGLVDISSRGILTKKTEDVQVPIKDQSLLSLDSSLTAITTIDVGAAGAGYTQAYANLQTDLLNEIKGKVNDLITATRTGLFKQ